MNTPAAAVAAAVAAPAESSEPSLEASDDFQEPRRYCPVELLDRFALLMAGHGRCVRTAMMLGDREYAMWQLACARAIDDAELAEVAQRLFAYFDETICA